MWTFEEVDFEMNEVTVRIRVPMEALDGAPFLVRSFLGDEANPSHVETIMTKVLSLLEDQIEAERRDWEEHEKRSTAETVQSKKRLWGR